MDPSVTFSVPWHEVYAKIVIDNASLSNGGGVPFQPPPLRDPTLKVRPSANAQGVDQIKETFGRSWTGWFEAVYDALRNLFIGTQVLFEVPSIDELDGAWYAVASPPPDDHTDPFTFTASIQGASIFARDFHVGDYILWNDPRIIDDLFGEHYAYEINKIIAMQGTGTSRTITVQRRPAGEVQGKAYFGTYITSHLIYPNFWRMIDNKFTRIFYPNSTPQTICYDEGRLDNVCVPAVRATPHGGTPVTVTTMPPLSDYPAPGMRTMNGNQYVLGKLGSVVELDTSDKLIKVAGPESIRYVFAEATSVTTKLILQVVYINSSFERAALLDEITIPAGSRVSYLTDPFPPGLNNMPHRAAFPSAWNTSWPPNYLCEMSGVLDADGHLIAPGTADRTSIIKYENGGWIDFIVKSGSATDVSVTVQT